MNEKQQIQHIFSKKNNNDRNSYYVRLTVSVDSIRFLLRQGLAFRGHDESQNSTNQGNFLELLTFLADHNEEIRVVALKSAPKNLKLTSPKIQKDIVNAAIKEQIVVMFRYVDKKEYVIERFIGIEHVPNTTALQLALMGVAKKHDLIVNIVGASSKRRDIFREKQAAKVIEALKSGQLSSAKGLNQDNGIKRPCETHWGSHFRTLVSFTIMFSSIIDVLEEIANDSLNSDQKYEASIMLQDVQTYDFVFSLHLVKNILGIINELSQVLQRGDQDIVNAMDLVRVCKKQLQMMRDNGWNSLMEEVSDFCVEMNIDVLNMDNMYCAQGKSRQKTPKLTNFHFFRIDYFNTVIDLQLQELNSRFNEANTELLLCLECLSSNNSFSAFNKGKL
ncbi:uncharacterized protein LOC115704165 [Cannabis sativa]|uniref:uncharacterized protein LOC115704165 n=1 Tax=Cannabis sativa TaxID=3483 RepID=UPI0029C9CA7D|nr:uncharacterized protein LOC115704165 [Cannabis sativa]